ncbi:MAG: glycosyltransferase [Terriglobales bacterium]
MLALSRIHRPALSGFEGVHNMKVAMITAAFPPIKSGGSDYALRLAELAADHSIEMHVLTTSRAQAQPTRSLLKIYPIANTWDWLEMKPLMAQLVALEPEVIDIHFTGWVYNDHPMITFLATEIRKQLPDTHICVHLESLGGVRRDKGNLLDVAVRWGASFMVGREGINYEYGSLMRDCHSVIFLNERDKIELARQFPETSDKGFLLPPPPIMPVSLPLSAGEIVDLREKHNVQNFEIVIAFYGYVYPGKGLETLFSALYHVVSKKREAGVLIIGGLPEQRVLDRSGKSNYLGDLKASLESLNLTQRVRWIGYAESSSVEPSRLLRASDICVLPFDAGLMLHNSSFSFAAMHGPFRRHPDWPMNPELA